MDARVLGWSMALALSVIFTPAWAQLGAGRDEPAAKEKDGTASGGDGAGGAGGAVKMADKPLHLENIGLTISLPLGAKSESTTMGEQAAVTIKDGDGAWVVSMRMSKTKRLEMTAKDLGETGLEQVFGRKDVKVGEKNEAQTELIGLDAEMKISGLDASRFYVELPAKDPSKALVRGATMIRVEPGRFATFEVMVPKGRFETSKAVVETMIATASFVDETGVIAGRRAAVEAGQSFLDQVTADDLDRAMQSLKERWVRLYKPAETGSDADATEVGYQRIRAWKGMRGEVDSKRKVADFSETEKQIGSLIRIDARVLDHEQGRVIDTQAVFYLSPDKERESWGVTTAVRSLREDEGRKKPPAVSTEVGTREGKNIVVIGDRAGDEQHEMKMPPEGYVSRVESVLLPQLLVMKKLETDFGFYNYQSDTKLIRLRRDRVERVKDSDVLWRVKTTLNEEAEESVATYRDGEMTSVVLATGVRMEPTDLQGLLKLWKSKGLPVD